MSRMILKADDGTFHVLLAVYLGWIWLVVWLAGCAVKPSPELVAARAVTVLELVQAVQRSLIAAHDAGLVDTETTRAALIQINEGVEQAMALGPILEGWHDLDAGLQERQLIDAVVVVGRLSQILGELLLPADQMTGVRAALLGANELLLRLGELRGGR